MIVTVADTAVTRKNFLHRQGLVMAGSDLQQYCYTQSELGCAIVTLAKEAAADDARVLALTAAEVLKRAIAPCSTAPCDSRFGFQERRPS